MGAAPACAAHVLRSLLSLAGPSFAVRVTSRIPAIACKIAYSFQSENVKNHAPVLLADITFLDHKFNHPTQE
jgi:hypothetical protein